MKPSILLPRTLILIVALAGALVWTGCEARANAPQAAAIPHPLDPLSAAEHAKTVELLRAAGHVDEEARFAALELREPAKASVLAWRPGGPFGRAAFAIVKRGARTYEAVVDLTAGAVVSWTEIEGVQPSLLVEEFIGVGEILAGSPEFTSALAARGLSMDEVLCAPLSVGNFGIPGHEGRRLLKTPCFLLGEVSLFNRPIEGLWAVVDVNARRVLEVVDEGIIPISDAPARLDEAAVSSGRASLAPVFMHQPEGVNFTIRGHLVEWDNWRLHQRLDKRAGLVVSAVSYREGNEARPVLYQGALSEIFVPYMDPSGAWYSRTFMDAGEYGFGANATPLAPGYDCPESAVLLDAELPDDFGSTIVAEDVICIFERNVGDPAWRHFDNLIGQSFEGRRAVELVVRTAAAIGNYDYFLDWVFTQDGRIVVRIGATGFDGLKGVASRSMADPGAAADAAYGTLVAPNLVATNHDHFFSFRLDVDVGGTANSLSVDRLRRVAFEGPRKSGWVVRSQVAATERAAQLDYDPAAPAYWRVVNPSAAGPAGHAPGYVLQPGNSVAYSLLARDDAPQRRAGFTDHQLWVTPYAPEERYAAGAYVNQSPGGLGLPKWTRADRPIADTDIVLWYTAGFHHVPRTEDFPVMPSAWHEFSLVPFNFFARNPALDVPTDWRGTASDE